MSSRTQGVDYLLHFVNIGFWSIEVVLTGNLQAITSSMVYFVTSDFCKALVYSRKADTFVARLYGICPNDLILKINGHCMHVFAVKTAATCVECVYAFLWFCGYYCTEFCVVLKIPLQWSTFGAKPLALVSLVCPSWKVSGSNLTPRYKSLYLRPSSFRNKISVNGSWLQPWALASYRHNFSFLDRQATMDTCM